jgi:ABC-type multidrug transport system fused ATPase/permease subunit
MTKLTKLIYEISIICGKENNKNFIILLFLMLISAFLEAISIGAVIPLFASIIKPEMLQENTYIRSIFSYFNFSLETTQLISLLCSFLALAFAIKVIFSFFLARIQGNIIYNIRVHISNKLYKHYINLNYREFLNRNISDIIHNTTGLSASFVLTYLVSLLGIIAELLIIIFITSLLFLVNPSITILIILLMSLLLFTYARWGRTKLNEIGKVQRYLLVELYKCASESLSAFKETKLYGKEEFSIKILIPFQKNTN